MITKRTTNRKGAWAPWHGEVSQLFWYTVAYHQATYEVAIHNGVLVVTHDHLSATPKHANLPQFVGQVHSESSKALNTLLAREKYDALGNVWDSRQPHYLRLMDAPAQAVGSQYVRMNCVAAGLDTQAVEDEAVVAARVNSLVTEVRSAMKDEAAAVVEQATGDVGEFRKKPEDRHVVARHRYERNKVHAGDGTARVIVKRDRRRGRSPGKHAAHNRHGADPPA